MKKITTIFLAVFALLTSCENSHIELDTPEEARETIELSLGALTVDQMGAGTAEVAQQEDETIPLTKSSLSIEPSTTVKNLWVLQFSNQGVIMGTPQYIDRFDTLEISQKVVKLIPTGVEEGSESTIVYLANTFNDKLIQVLGNNYTIDNVAALSHSITDEDSNFVTDEDGTKYMIMYGSITQNITSGTRLNSCTLKRTVAKITVTMINNGTDLKFLRSEIDGIPNRSYYYPTLTEKHPADGTFHTIDYPVEDLNELVDGKTSFTFYVPTNRRGIVNNDSQLSKNHFGSHNHMSINITTQDDNDDIYFYTFFLGANLIDDFNIDCDKEYKYNLTFDSKGDPSYDERVTLLNSTDYTKNTIPRSNCYILNPSDLTDQTIYIPIDRIDEFWRNKSGYTESTYTDNNILSNVKSDWEAVLMWHDSEYTLDGEGDAQNLGGLKVAKGTSPSSKGVACVVVTLPRYYQHCNVGFVVRRTDEKHKGDILWSWHLWITDYNPYPKRLLPSLNIGSYDVDGGALHRYKNPAFEGGIYSDKFIMDRNIGARSADFKGHGSINNDNNTVSAGSLYYQFGRKDPFSSAATYLNGYEYTTGVDAAKQQSFEYSVNNPEKFIYIDALKNWCRNANSTNYIWNDYKIEAEGYTSGKSIFDPSPLGFRLPISDTWSDFTGGKESDETAPNNNFTFIWTRYQTPILEEYNYGRLYTGYAYYPTSGQMPDRGDILVGYKGNGYCWSANSSTENNGCYLGFGSAFLSKELSVVRAKGYPVRPIQE